MKKWILLYTPIIFALTASTHLHATDDYLSTLENESNSTHVDLAGEHTNIAKTKKHEALNQLIETNLPDNLSKTDFKIFLMDNLFDSYMSYLELDKSKRDIIFQQYNESEKPNINLIESLISHLSK